MNKIKHEELSIPENDPFANCRLNRRQYAERLAVIVNNYRSGFVLAINNKWGHGKTTFVKMWLAYLDNVGNKTLYFNAWENDFETNPLVPIMDELKKLSNPKSKKYQTLIEKGAKISKAIIPAAIKAVASKVIGDEAARTFVDSVTEDATDLLAEEIKEYRKKKDGLKDFKLALEEYLNEVANDKPVVFAVDELDRCRPNYAVEVLETIKHLFNVPNIVFVLSIDKIQLGHAIQGYYGSNLIDSEEYLKRFIDLEYSLPEPDTKTFCNYLFRYFDFGEIMLTDFRRTNQGLMYEPASLIDTAVLLFKNGGLTLRQQEKIFVHTRVALLFVKQDYYSYPELLLILVFIKLHHTSFYKQLQSGTLPVQEVINNFNNIMPKTEGDERWPFIIAESWLTLFYFNAFKNRNNQELIIKNPDGVEKLTVESRMEPSGIGFQERLKDSSGRLRGTSLKYLTDKIDFIDDFEAN